VLDGAAVLWVVHWPVQGVIADFVENFKGFLLKKLLDSDVYLIFDRYHEYSTKSVTRDARTCEASRVYQLTENTPLPSQKDDVPTEIHKGLVIARRDITTSHEADNIIVQQAIMCAKEQSGATVVVADDTDVFILLLYHYWNEHLTCPMFMISPIQQRSLIDIKTTIQAHCTTIPGLPAAHALSGCDTVPTYFEIGKGTVLKNLIAAPNLLSLLGCSDAPLPDVVDQATKFISACYSKTVHEKTMSDVRYKIWDNKVWKYCNFSPKDTSTATYHRSICREREESPPSDRYLESSTDPRSTYS
jgi:hypothetical protein